MHPNVLADWWKRAVSLFSKFNAVTYKYAYLQKHQNCISFKGIDLAVVSGKRVNEWAKGNSRFLHT